MYVVTGATGNTGSVVARKLLAAGQRVRVIGRQAQPLLPLIAAGAEAWVCDLEDAESLAKAFSGAQGVYALIPPALNSPNYVAYKTRIADSLAAALDGAQVEYAVTLSSLRASTPDAEALGIQPDLERKLQQISRLNVLHLRPGYFMENTLALIGPLTAMGVAAGPLLPALKLPLIAARDVGAAAATALLEHDFSGQRTRELHGQRDLSMNQVAAIIGKAIDKPNLVYLHLPAEHVRPGMIEAGMSPDVADLMLELMTALNTGSVTALEPRSVSSTTPTSYETFVAEVFAPIYQNALAAAYS